MSVDARSQLDDDLNHYAWVAEQHKNAHFKAARRSRMLEISLQVSALSVQAVVSGTLLTTLFDSRSHAIILGILSAFALVVSGFLLFLKPAEKHASHRLFVTEFASLERKIKAKRDICNRHEIGEAELQETLKWLDDQLTRLATQAPYVSAPSLARGFPPLWRVE